VSGTVNRGFAPKRPSRGAAILPVVSRIAFALGLGALLASCNRAPRVETPAPGARPLATYAAQRLAVTPVAAVRGDSLGWVQSLGGAQLVARRADSLVQAALAERGVGGQWVWPAELIRTFERNRSYAADPRNLAVTPLRAPTFATLSPYGEPLSTQLRTMIALHGDTRYVLLPVELRFERVDRGGRAILRVALLDPRFAEARWVGELRGDTTSVPADALADVGIRLADLFIAP
jgi:hypothetical protein